MELSMQDEIQKRAQFRQGKWTEVILMYVHMSSVISTWVTQSSFQQDADKVSKLLGIWRTEKWLCLKIRWNSRGPDRQYASQFQW